MAYVTAIKALDAALSRVRQELTDVNTKRQAILRESAGQVAHYDQALTRLTGEEGDLEAALLALTEAEPRAKRPPGRPPRKAT